MSLIRSRYLKERRQNHPAHSMYFVFQRSLHFSCSPHLCRISSSFSSFITESMWFDKIILSTCSKVCVCSYLVLLLLESHDLFADLIAYWLVGQKNPRTLLWMAMPSLSFPIDFSAFYRSRPYVFVFSHFVVLVQCFRLCVTRFSQNCRGNPAFIHIRVQIDLEMLAEHWVDL